jgi:adenine-specific DNA-methyltransferase
MMQLTAINPKKSINKAFFKEKVSRADIERFKEQLISLFNKIEATYSEDTLKDFVTEFLRKTWYDNLHAITINKERKDLAIHSGKWPKDTVAVITEVKRIGSPEMIVSTRINVKAFHELVLYYLEERVNFGNIEIKHLIATDVYEWYVFDANEFDKKISRNPQIKKLFEVYKNDKKDNNFFYGELKKIIQNIEDEITCTYFNLQTIRKEVFDTSNENDNKLIPFFKILSPEHLLKKPFANDSNALDKTFYDELLYLIGLEEKKDGNKRLIERLAPEARCSGSLLESAISKLKSKRSIYDIPNVTRYGEDQEAQYFNIALELCITWVNRILFLKLLESQLYSYHKKAEVLFLNSKLLYDYDDLNTLFFDVLAEKHESREPELQQKYSQVPYLNSSLFERTKIERKTIEISAFNNKQTLAAFRNTVLKNSGGKKLSGNIPTLDYILKFLDAYDFTSEGKAVIQEENKKLINASVLGLIFEKINGYKDGSFFTPGFITMYMCKEAIRNAVIQKFKETKNWQISSFEDLYDKIDDRAEANVIINSITICDPAVGSGHFLVSALNELVSLKADLKILQDKSGKRLKEYHIEVVNDELIVTDEDGELFEYKPGHPESQRIQETLFHEKEQLIENCLFGVDINPNSVKICSLRLWIELLKNAYYTSESGYRYLETLPNIDINIKEGNTLISRFSLDADISEVLRQSQWDIEEYKETVRKYKETNDKVEKRKLEEQINSIKNDFTSHLSFRDKIAKDFVKERAEVVKISSEINRRKEWNEDAPKKLTEKLAKAEEKLKKLEIKIEQINNNKIFETAFEWRFEFPEALDADGNFMGFDVVIGNPPYIRHERIAWMKAYLKKTYTTYSGTADLFIYFVERGLKITRKNGQFIYILPSKWMKSGYGEPLRLWVSSYNQISIVDFGDLPVFEEATTYPCIWHIEKKGNELPTLRASIVQTLKFPEGLKSYIDQNSFYIDKTSFLPSGWSLLNAEELAITRKLEMDSISLRDYVSGKLFRGILTGLNEAFVIDTRKRNELIAVDPKSSEVIKPFLAGKDIERFKQPETDNWVILFKSGTTKQMFETTNEDESWEQLSRTFPAIANHLLPFRKKAQKRLDKGGFWWELRACDYYDEFEQPKILYQEIAAYSTFTFDGTGLYTNNKLFFIPTTNKNLLGLLNSKLSWFWLKKKANILRGALALQSPYVLSIPIKQAVLDSEQLTVLVNSILTLKAENLNIETDDLEQQVDEIIYQIYGITAEEKAIIGNVA